MAGGKTPANDLAALLERIEQVEGRGADACGGRAEAVRPGLPRPLDRLERGMLHEWLCGGDDEEDGRPWTAPILVFTHLAAIAARENSSGGRLVWIGRRVWPQPHLLVRPSAPCGHDLLNRSLLIDPPTLDDRLWAIALSLRSPSVAAVIADVSGMGMAHSRRLQLAAESGDAVALFARPWRERRQHTAAARRWRIQPALSPNASPRWEIELVRCKGVQRGGRMDACAKLIVEHDHATHCLRAPADVADRSRPEAGSTIAQRPEPIRQTG